MAKSTPKPTKLTPASWVALGILRTAETPLTLAQLNANSEDVIGAANLTQLTRKGLVSAVKTEFICACCGSKSEKNVYTITDAGIVYNETEQE